MECNSNLLKIINPVVVDDSHYFVKDLFQKKFGCAPPKQGIHLIGFYKNKDGYYLPASYICLTPFKKTLLVGGVMTDGRVIKQMSDEEKQIITECGGIYLNLLKYTFERFAQDCDAFFGYCNNPRALEVDLAAGFVETEYQYLLVNFHKPLSAWRKKKLFKIVNKLGPF